MKSRTAGYILGKDQPNIVNSRMYSYIKNSDIPRAEGYLDVNCGRISRATVYQEQHYIKSTRI
jgi:hypothetical protein